MAVSGLLDINSPAFPFDHDQLHRAMAYNTPAFIAPLALLLDPMSDIAIPAGNWNTGHAEAHAAFAQSHPAILSPSTVSLADIDLNSGATNWWAFSNWRLHELANSQLPTNE